jgi:hypothetical protein
VAVGEAVSRACGTRNQNRPVARGLQRLTVHG